MEREFLWEAVGLCEGRVSTRDSKLESRTLKSLESPATHIVLVGW